MIDDEDGVAGLTAGLRQGRYSAEELARHYLDRIARLDPRYGAFTEVFEARALRAARQSDQRRRRGALRHRLDGIPFAVKDNFELAGTRTAAGTVAWQDRISRVTAVALQRLLDAGGVLLGKTHMTELAYSGWGVNRQLTTPVNPWSAPERPRVAGGSSSGSGVAVAAGLTPVALGTDTGGSVRHPAAFCGLTALRPAVGRYDTQGVIPLAPLFDVIGILGRSAQDVGLCDAWLSGLADDEVAANGDDDGGGWRVGVLSPDDYPVPVDPVIEQVITAAAQQLREAGAQVLPVSLPVPYRDMAPVQARLTVAQAYRSHAAEVARATAGFSDALRTWLSAGRAVDDVAYAAALAQRDAHVARFRSIWQQCDALLCPVVPVRAGDIDAIDDTQTHLYAFTRPVAYVGACAVAFPAGFCADGLPVGAQLVAPAGSERQVLRRVAAFQRGTHWHRRRPPAE